MNAYNIGATLPPQVPPMIANSAALVPHIDQSPTVGAPAGFPVYNTPVVMPQSKPLKTPTHSKNFSTPITNPPTSKRKNSSKDVSDAPVTAKRSRTQPSTELLQAEDPNTLTQQNNIVNSSLQHSAVQGSNVLKCLFNKPSQFPSTNSSCPKTPARSTSSPTDKFVSPPEITNVTPQQMTVITSEKITVNPSKQKGFSSIKRSSQTSSSSPIKATNMKRASKRDHVKGRLDFDGPEIEVNSDKLIPGEVLASKTEKELDILDFDLPNLDVMGSDFSFSELLGELDLDLDVEGMNCSYQPNMDYSLDSSNVIEVLSEKNMNTPGPDSVTSITKCLKILSPVNKEALSKIRRISL